MEVDLYKMRAVVLKALAHPDRLRVFDLLSGQGERCVCDIAEALEISQPMTSKHVAMLRDAGLLDSRKEGALVFYRVSTPCLVEFFKCLDRSISHSIKSRQGILEETTERTAESEPGPGHTQRRRYN